MAPGSVPSARGVAGSGTHVPGCSASGPSPEPTPGLAMSRHRQASRARPDGGYRPPGEPVLLCLPRPPSSCPRRPRALRHYCGRGQAAPFSAPMPWTWAATGPQPGDTSGKARRTAAHDAQTAHMRARRLPPATGCGLWTPGPGRGRGSGQDTSSGPPVSSGLGLARGFALRLLPAPGAEDLRGPRRHGLPTTPPPQDPAPSPGTCSGQHLHHGPTAVPHPRPTRPHARNGIGHPPGPSPSKGSGAAGGARALPGAGGSAQAWRPRCWSGRSCPPTRTARGPWQVQLYLAPAPCPSSPGRPPDLCSRPEGGSLCPPPL